MFWKKVNNDNEDELQAAAEDLKKGSAEAFHMLYTKYSRKVYRFCLRFLGDESQAQDAFQETFIKVFENRSQFRGENFSSWLFAIARNTCLNVIRTQKGFEIFDEFEHTNFDSLESDIGVRDYIKSSISRLPLPLREAVLLREYEDCSYQEIAEILNIDISLAKVRVHRARAILKKLLKPLVKEINESR
jgi:RNA polymerase sigma-70 factor, ECF subfamily